MNDGLMYYLPVGLRQQLGIDRADTSIAPFRDQVSNALRLHKVHYALSVTYRKSTSFWNI